MKKKIPIIIVAMVILVLLGLIINNLFGGSDSPRIKNGDKHILTNKEKNAVKDVLEEIDNVDSVKIYSNVKIIKILVNLTEDTDFNNVKEKSNEAVKNISDENLEFYDVEIYVETKVDSEIYPKIGYKNKLRSEFSW